MSTTDSTTGGSLVGEIAKVKPGKNEFKSDFVSRCVSAMADEGVDDDDQRVAMCNSAWEKAMKKRDTVLKAAEIVIDYYGDDEPEEELDVSCNVLKAYEENGEMYVEGMVLVPDATDRQGDSVSETEIKKAAYRFMEDSQSAGVMHQKILPAEDVSIVEAFIPQRNMKRNGMTLKKGSFVVKYRVKSEEVKKDIRDGKLKAFSIGGRGQEEGD